MALQYWLACVLTCQLAKRRSFVAMLCTCRWFHLVLNVVHFCIAFCFQQGNLHWKKRKNKRDNTVHLFLCKIIFPSKDTFYISTRDWVFLIAQVSDIGSHHQQQQASLFGCFPLVGNRLVIMLFCRICKVFHKKITERVWLFAEFQQLRYYWHLTRFKWRKLHLIVWKRKGLGTYILLKIEC